METEEIYVGMGDLKKALYPNILCSGGLGPCIAVAVYHPATRSGYMLHEHHADIEAKIKEIQEDYRDLSDNLCGELYLYTSSGKFIVDTENLADLCYDEMGERY